MRTPGGEYASHIGIFVKIAMNKLSQKQASSSGMCSQQDTKISVPQRLSSSKILETYPINPDRQAETTIAIKDHEDKGKETNSANSYRSFSHGTAADGNGSDLLRKGSRIVHQEAAIQCTAEIHANPFTYEGYGYRVTEV